MHKTMTEEERKVHRARIQRAIDSITPEEDAALTKAALDDPDTVLITSLTKRRPGRPIAAAPKMPVSIRLSPDVLDYYRSTGPGWQSRIDETLRKAAGLKKNA
ncbi:MULTISPECIES: BrnA antitoxin family protein [unclassified Phyllobacterium]|uniref:BrnA antitoxin family protein n=1 Tax=unclassified Phyllobacterium TaxID=2638441 RepID=UPI003012F9D3